MFFQTKRLRLPAEDIPCIAIVADANAVRLFLLGVHSGREDVINHDYIAHMVGEAYFKTKAFFFGDGGRTRPGRKADANPLGRLTQIISQQKDGFKSQQHGLRKGSLQ